MKYAIDVLRSKQANLKNEIATENDLIANYYRLPENKEKAMAKICENEGYFDELEKAIKLLSAEKPDGVYFSRSDMEKLAAAIFLEHFGVGHGGIAKNYVANFISERKNANDEK